MSVSANLHSAIKPFQCLEFGLEFLFLWPDKHKSAQLLKFTTKMNMIFDDCFHVCYASKLSLDYMCIVAMQLK